MDRYSIERYIEDTYCVKAEHPFEKSPETCVFRHNSNRKWFAVIMEIPRSRLSPGGEGIVQIINTKCDYILINSFLTEKGFYPAYHMNKAHWITTVLDGTVEKERIEGLIDISYELTDIKRTSKKRYRGASS